MLMKNKKLLHLDIGRNSIFDDGVIHVINGLRYNNTLTELFLYSCKMTIKGTS